MKDYCKTLWRAICNKPMVTLYADKDISLKQILDVLKPAHIVGMIQVHIIGDKEDSLASEEVKEYRPVKIVAAYNSIIVIKKL